MGSCVCVRVCVRGEDGLSNLLPAVYRAISRLQITASSYLFKALLLQSHRHVYRSNPNPTIKFEQFQLLNTKSKTQQVERRVELERKELRQGSSSEEMGVFTCVSSEAGFGWRLGVLKSR